MCVNHFSNWSDEEKINLMKDYIDMLMFGECYNYDMFYKIQSDNKLKKSFFREVVPLAFDEIDLEKLFVDNLPTLEILRQNLKNLAFEYPRFYLMCAVAGALDCF